MPMRHGRHERTRELAGEGRREDLQRALHLADFVIRGRAELLDEARALKIELLQARVEQEPSFIARNILSSAAILEKDRLAADGEP